MLVLLLGFIACYTIKLIIVSIKVLGIMLYVLFWGMLYVPLLIIELLATALERVLK